VPDLEYANNHAGEGEDYESGKDCGGGFFHRIAPFCFDAALVTFLYSSY